MHELSIMESALDLALDQAQKAGATRVHVVRLRIGTLSGVVPEALQFAFEALTPGTLAEGAALDIENIPAKFWCSACARGRGEYQRKRQFGTCFQAQDPCPYDHF